MSWYFSAFMRKLKIIKCIQYVWSALTDFLTFMISLLLPRHELHQWHSKLLSLKENLIRFLSRSPFSVFLHGHGVKSSFDPSTLQQKDWFMNGRLLEAIYAPQWHTWDCGVACLSMICNVLCIAGALDKSENRDIANMSQFVDILSECDPTTPDNLTSITMNQYGIKIPLSGKYDSPLWTVDLYYELQRVLLSQLVFNEMKQKKNVEQSSESESIHCATEYYTAFAGVREEHYERFEWYGRQHSEVDQVRVQHIFDMCREQGWSVSHRRFTGEALALELAEPGTTAVLLVDKTLLLSNQAQNDETTETTDNICDHCTYTGHFIYVLGCTLYQEGATEGVLFHYLDPARPRYGSDGLLSTHTVASEALDRARCHPGTDEDIVFVRIT